MFNITEELHLSEFKAWAGGRDRLNKAEDYDMVDELQDYIIHTYGAELTASQLNDILWFEIDDFFEEIEEDE